MDRAIEVRGLTKQYGRVLAVDHIDFDVQEGEVFGFLGPNGAGKTTTIRMLTGLSKPTAGSARVLGHDVIGEIVKAKAGFGVVPELSNMYDELTGFENLIFMGQLYGVPRSDRPTRAEDLLRVFGLYERKDSQFASYSRGMKRALTIAAALVHKPRLLFLDEPTVGLDVMVARTLRAMLQRLSKEGMTIFLTTHYLEEADLLCDRIAILVKGKVMAIETPAKLKAMVEEESAIEVLWNAPLPQAAEELSQRFTTLRFAKVDGGVRAYGGSPTQLLQAILQYARDNQIEVAAVNSIRPSLEDAFIKLTGLSPLVMVAEKGGRQNVGK
ncbi:MAG: ABC transporter ATP-binding protein [Chloroflexota bacterium]